MEHRASRSSPTRGAGAGSKKRVETDPVGRLVALSHPDKILYGQAGFTKRDVAAYYAKVSPRMLPYVKNRMLSVVRCPGGTGDACFFKKHPNTGQPGLVPLSVPVSGGHELYFYLTDATGLLAEVQRNALEFHIWGSRVPTLEKPDMMVFDLDPDEGLDSERVRQGVRDLKSVLDRLSLPSYLKSSGGKGYHVVIPVRPEAGWDAFHAFAGRVAARMESTWPDRYTGDSRKENRKNRIFVDWQRNARGASSVAPYSLRPGTVRPYPCPFSGGIWTPSAPTASRWKTPWRDCAARTPGRTFTSKPGR